MTVLPAFSAVIPAFNEASRIDETLRLTLDYLRNASPESELILVNDGSTDATSPIAREVLETAKIATRLLENFPNRGKGAAVRSGLLAAQKPIALFFDADLSTPLDETPKVIEPISDGEIDIAFGSRALDRRLIGHRQPWRREQAGRVFNLLVRLATGLPFWTRNVVSKHCMDVCRPIGSRAHRWLRLRRRAALSRAARRIAHPRNSGALESFRRQQGPLFPG
jgi:glycosyltransferase involved in cell wall biosynthesis